MFFSPLLTNQAPLQQNEKIVLSRFDITLLFANAGEIDNTYKVQYLITIKPQIRASNINKESLKKAILANIPIGDEKYMYLKYFDTYKVIFYLNFNKWFIDTMKNYTVKSSISKFEKTYKFKVVPPRMIAFDVMQTPFANFLTKKFKKYIMEKKQEKKFLISFLPDSLVNKLKTKIVNMYDYEYNLQFNEMNCKMKSIYIFTILMAGSYFLSNANKFLPFDKKVEQNLVLKQTGNRAFFKI